MPLLGVAVPSDQFARLPGNGLHTVKIFVNIRAKKSFMALPEGAKIWRWHASGVVTGIQRHKPQEFVASRVP